ncbi:MAG: threonine synthase [Bdellovibrionales bacterium]|nr:threonine synthase [Bdellovibrionales bacterium]
MRRRAGDPPFVMTESLKWFSTRGSRNPFTTRETISRGLAPDGGLFFPSHFPHSNEVELAGLDSFPEIAALVLAPYFQGDPLKEQLPEICQQAFNFPLILKKLDAQTRVLELFHGPTAAFKDFGARFLAQVLSRIQPRTTILVATSGDTGGAVASAFHKVKGVNVVVLFPKDRISPRQKHQLTAWGDNILSLEIDGDFDACQRMVKECFQDENLSQDLNLSSANSINVGRLLPQMAYYACAGTWSVRRMGTPLQLLIPSGNLGNAVGALWAQQMGFPVGKIGIVTNANETLLQYFKTGVYEPRKSVATLANAMDVGNPSNFERLKEIFPRLDLLKKNGISFFSVGDEEIRKSIRQTYDRYQEIVCPHTATASWIAETIKPFQPVTWVATAHASKFETIVEPSIGRSVELAPQLKEILSRKPVYETLESDVAALKKKIRQAFG